MGTELPGSGAVLGPDHCLCVVELGAAFSDHQVIEVVFAV